MAWKFHQAQLISSVTRFKKERNNRITLVEYLESCLLSLTVGAGSGFLAALWALVKKGEL